jgi:hypothetical protein
MPRASAQRSVKRVGKRPGQKRKVPVAAGFGYYIAVTSECVLLSVVVVEWQFHISNFRIEIDPPGVLHISL